MKWALALLIVTGVAAQRRIDLNAPPWDAVMSALQRQSAPDAMRDLERIGDDVSVVAWQRAHAFSWAGEIAERRNEFDRAARDFARTRELDAEGFEGRMACVKLGRLAMRQEHWVEADRWLSQVEHDPDPIIHAYATADLQSVRLRVRRMVLRYGSIAILALGLIAVAIRLLRRRLAQPGAARRFGRALLIGEALAIVSVPVVRRLWSPLATSGWMAAAIPLAVVAALLWATRRADAPTWRKGLVLVGYVVAFAAAVYVAEDFLWWSAHAA